VVQGAPVVEPIIGLEVHVQLATRTKLWCACAVEFGAPPNSRVCPVCLGLPGALPVLNRRAVEQALLTGLALNCQIARVTRWDRKSYYYPDLPKNYQISQYVLPLARDGYIELKSDHQIRKIRIRRAHLEEDAGKNVHDLADCTAVDLNRAGTPLLEIVTEPDLRSADEAHELALQLQRLVRYLGVSEANMQKGQMRFEPNVNLRIVRDGREYLTPIVEVKNLNSFRALHAAIAFEIQRQLAEWQQTGQVAEPGNKLNRGWDDLRQVTTPQRQKEEACDYRYFPDPDLVPLTIDPQWVAALRAHLPEQPLPRTERFISEYKLDARDAAALVDCRATADLLDHAAEAGGDKLILGKHFLSFWAHWAHERQTTVAGLGIPARRMAELANLVRDGRVSATAAARIAQVMAQRADELLLARPEGAANAAAEPDAGGQEASAGPDSGAPGAGEKLRALRPAAGNCVIEFRPVDGPQLDPATLAEELGLLQTSERAQVADWVEQALAANPQAARDAVANPRKLKAARGFLVGQVMRLSGGKADPSVAGTLLDQALHRISTGTEAPARRQPGAQRSDC